MKINIAIFVYTIWLCLFFCACVTKKPQKSKSYSNPTVMNQSSVIDRAEAILEQEAKLSDIPRFLQAKPLPSYFTESNNTDEFMIGYATTENLVSMQSFYESEMEQLGWRQLMGISGPELILLFEKPSRWCTISIRPSSLPYYQTDIVIASSLKQEDMYSNQKV